MRKLEISRKPHEDVRCTSRRRGCNPRYILHQGRRYRLKFRNASDDIHPLHLHRHSFELVRTGGKAAAGIMKDVVMLGGFQEAEFDFIADNPGLTLFH
jgi:FtsP/CotA-like multicopper oxidase with cupredoxin domain